MVRNLFARLKAWLPLLSLGNTRSRKNELTEYSRYLVLQTLKEEHILDSFRNPISVEELISKYNWEHPSKYVDDFLQMLEDDKVISKTGNKYFLNIDLDKDLQKPIVHHIEDFNSVFATYATEIPKRLQGKYTDYTGQMSLFNWDSVLAGQIYQAVRDSAFALINIKDLRNANLLEIGCGPGHETADIWVRLSGLNVKITAIEPDPALLKIAREEFCRNIVKRGGPNTTWEELVNPPKFILGTAEKLVFENDTFDAVYFANILHWLSNPLEGIKESVRVLKPGGLIFGGQGTREVTNPYLDITARVIKNTHGYFSKKQFIEWFNQAGIHSLIIATLVNSFKGRK